MMDCPLSLPDTATLSGLRLRQISGGTPRRIIAVGESSRVAASSPTVGMAFMFPSPVGAAESLVFRRPDGACIPETHVPWVSLTSTAFAHPRLVPFAADAAGLPVSMASESSNVSRCAREDVVND